MKHFLLGLGILAALLAIGFWVQSCLDGIHLEISHTLEQASQQTLEGHWEQGQALVDRAKGEWEDHWRKTAAIADHTLMDEIDSLFSQLEVYGQTRQTGHYCAICAQLAVLVEVVAEGHRLSWWNLL